MLRSTLYALYLPEDFRKEEGCGQHHVQLHSVRRPGQGDLLRGAAACSTMRCPVGTVNRGQGHHCKHTKCSVTDKQDVDTCCQATCDDFRCTAGYVARHENNQALCEESKCHEEKDLLHCCNVRAKCKTFECPPGHELLPNKLCKLDHCDAEDQLICCKHDAPKHNDHGMDDFGHGFGGFGFGLTETGGARSATVRQHDPLEQRAASRTPTGGDNASGETDGSAASQEDGDDDASDSATGQAKGSAQEQQATDDRQGDDDDDDSTEDVEQLAKTGGSPDRKESLTAWFSKEFASLR